MEKYKINKKKILSNIDMILTEYEEYMEHNQYTDDELTILFHNSLKGTVSIMCGFAEKIHRRIHTKIGIIKLKNKLHKEMRELEKR